MNLWPINTDDVEGTLFLVDKKEDEVILIISQVFGEHEVIYDPAEIIEFLENLGVSKMDVMESETDCLDFDRQIFKVFWEA